MNIEKTSSRPAAQPGRNRYSSARNDQFRNRNASVALGGFHAITNKRK